MPRIAISAIALCLIVWSISAFLKNYVTSKVDSTMKAVEWPSLKDQWLDVDLPIQEVKRISPGHFRVVTQGIYDGQVLGLTFDFNNIDPNTSFLANPANSLTATPNGVVITSQGKPTLNFIRKYAELAGKSVTNINVPTTINLTAITLGGEPQNIDTKGSKIKVFHADDQPEGPFYFEAFINPDVPHGYIGLHEKDPEYRDALLRSFGAQF